MYDGELCGISLGGVRVSCYDRPVPSKIRGKQERQSSSIRVDQQWLPTVKLASILQEM